VDDEGTAITRIALEAIALINTRGREYAPNGSFPPIPAISEVSAFDSKQRMTLAALSLGCRKFDN